jgi:purine-nucleoside phosphorylase
LYKKIESIFIENKFKFYPSVFLGIIGPESETEAECRFYREIGADVLGYGLVPENLAAIHSGLKCIAFGMISRELIADRFKEIPLEEQFKNRVLAERYFCKIIREVVNSL